MKIIQSFWSKPALNKNQNFKNNRKFGGWLHYKYFLMSNCLSCLTLKKYHKNISLYTDISGYEIFINQLRLPYHDVSLVLEELKDADHRLWVQGKLKTIKLQKEPFVHVDNDVFIWKSLPFSINPDFLLSQSKQKVPPVYIQSLGQVKEHFINIPSQLTKNIDEYKNIINIGLLGGNDINFFQNYCELAYDFLEINKPYYNKIDLGSFNQVLDEFLLSRLMEERGNVHLHINTDNEHKEYSSVLQFHLIPFLDNYIHMVGNAKLNVFACRQLELRLKYEYPEYHLKVTKIIASMDMDSGECFNYEEAKESRIYKAIQTAYTLDTAELKNIKIQLCDSVRLSEKKDENGKTKFIITEVNPFTGSEEVKEMEKADRVLFYFEEPTTINEMTEAISEELKGLGNQRLAILKDNLTTLVFERIIALGLLEFKS